MLPDFARKGFITHETNYYGEENYPTLIANIYIVIDTSMVPEHSQFIDSLDASSYNKIRFVQRNGLVGAEYFLENLIAIGDNDVETFPYKLAKEYGLWVAHFTPKVIVDGSAPVDKTLDELITAFECRKQGGIYNPEGLTIKFEGNLKDMEMVAEFYGLT